MQKYCNRRNSFSQCHRRYIISSLILPVSTFVSLGSVAIIPVEATYNITQGGNVSLEVYADGNPVIMSNEIQWTNPQGNTITPGGRYLFLNGNKHLIIQRAMLEDGGTFRVNIVREMSDTVSTTIELDVHGKCHEL